MDPDATPDRPMDTSLPAAESAPSQLVTAAASGANWFFWIAGLSVVNSVIQLLQSEWGFIVGLGITQVFDAIALAASEELGSTGAMVVKAIALGLDLLAAGFFALFGWLARRRMAWAFVVGMVIYALDGALFIFAQDWLGLGFHGFALFCIFGGYSAVRRLNAAAADSVATGPSLEPEGA